MSSSFDKPIKIWNFSNGYCLQTLKGHIYDVNCIHVLREDRIISGSLNGEIRVSCLKTNRCIKTINADPIEITGIQVLNDNQV